MILVESLAPSWLLLDAVIHLVLGGNFLNNAALGKALNLSSTPECLLILVLFLPHMVCWGTVDVGAIG
jgi:hypothetical protein